MVSENLLTCIPASIQRRMSSWLSCIFHLNISRYLIKPYCWLHYGDSNFYKKYLPGSGKPRYTSFHDFFIRDFQKLPQINSDSIWPCEGYLCQVSRASELQKIVVKGRSFRIHEIFGISENDIFGNLFFLNVFLHNHNYHHIHSPVSGKITRIQRVPGRLLVLRPWLYPDKPSVPAFTNERLNLDILDTNEKVWRLSLIGGPLVGKIKADKKTCVGSVVHISEKIATFEQGSTCCILGPISPSAKVGEQVKVGDPI